jgi:uncharacterized protein
VKNIGRCIAVVVALLAAGGVDASPRQGIDLPAPYAAAARIMRLAKLGDVKAQARLGWMYESGRGVPQNYYEAAKWYYRAAEAGNGWAQFELGLLYNKGQGVPRDFVLAHMWLNLSASQAVGDDRDFKARMRDAVASKMTAAQVAAAQQLARAWYKSR